MQKKLIIFAIALLLLFLSYKFLGKISSDIFSAIDRKKKNKELEQFLNTHQIDEGGTNVNNVETFAKAEYNLMADSLFSAMDGWGTDEATIYAILSRLRTKADWFALINAFGTRKSSWGSFKGTLPLWISDELGGSDKIRVNNLLGKFNVQI